jgi:membrane-bound lytic murein transglycosylase D
LIYQDSKSQKQVKRAARVVGTGVVLGIAFVGGTLHGRARFEEQQAANGAAGPALALYEPLLDVSASSESQPAWDLPNLDHPRVDYFTSMFTSRKKGEFEKYLARSGKYAPMISKKLEQRGMPQDLIYLAMIESGFNPKAYSPAAASGLWQFIGETGKRYGLEINRAVDERNDPEKATDAALTYLEELHDRFGSWYLAAAAYNTGENRVARIMREETGSEKGNENSYYEIWDRLPRETRDYVPLMIAAARIGKEPARYGFEDVEMEAPLEYDEVVVTPSSSISAIAEAAGTTVAEVKRLNPQLKLARTRNDEKSVVRIPSGSGDSFASSWSSVSARHEALAKAEARKAPVRTASTKRYTVRRGDNLSTIARRHGTTVVALQRANGMRNSRIRAGSVLKIPRNG